MNGYMGRILYVDLTEGRTRTEALDPEMARSFLGGWGVNARAWLPGCDSTRSRGSFTGKRRYYQHRPLFRNHCPGVVRIVDYH